MEKFLSSTAWIIIFAITVIAFFTAGLLELTHNTFPYWELMMLPFGLIITATAVFAGLFLLRQTEWSKPTGSFGSLMMKIFIFILSLIVAFFAAGLVITLYDSIIGLPLSYKEFTPRGAERLGDSARYLVFGIGAALFVVNLATRNRKPLKA